MTAQRYVHDILQLHVSPLMQQLPGAIFQQENARPHTARVSQTCLRTVTILAWFARFPDLSPIKYIWDNLRYNNQIFSDYVLVKSMGPKVLWTITAEPTGEGSWRIFPTPPAYA
ncbi:transposable element Tcb2 transposase [Trichonephila clavipes]|nr:transposable element Tcb2 transposase [Trichonephila clavipes]